MSKERVILASSGAVEYVTGRIEETNGEDLSTATFKVGLGGYETPPATWYEPSEVLVTGPVADVSMLVDNSTQLVEQAHVWVKVLDAPEVLLRRCSGGTVTVE